MDITYLGHSSFKIKGKGASVVTDPFPKKSEADIVTISHNHDDHNKAELIEGVKKVIQGPGEYEIAGVSIIGLASFHDGKAGAERGKNTMYIIEIDGFRILHLGDLGHKLKDSDIKEIGAIDILMIPVGGVYTIGPKEAVEVYKQVAPTIIIPMHYGGELAPVDEFINESGLRVEKMPKLSLKEGSLTNKEEEYAVILEKK